MSKLKVLLYPDKRLFEKCEPVTVFNEELAKTTRDMLETMYAQEGCGLAASQVGIMKRFCVIDTSENRSQPVVLVNPEIISHEGTLNCSEGCLSIPDYHETVKRFQKVKVVAYNVKGERFELEAEELFSRCIQHEMDHMDGIMFVDHGSPLKKQIFKRWMKKHVFVDKDSEEK